MKKYEYPKEVNENNFQELVKRSKDITKKSEQTIVASFVVSFILLTGAIIIYAVPPIRTIHNPQVVSEVSLAIAFGGL